MRDKTILKIITILGMSGWSFLFKKGPIKDWFIIYLFKTLLSTLMDAPVTKNKLVNYPVRYFANSFDTNIVFDYIIFPLLCVIYNQFTYNMKPLKTIFSVIFFSGPMTLIQVWLERNTRLVKYSKHWSWFHSFSILRDVQKNNRPIQRFL